MTAPVSSELTRKRRVPRAVWLFTGIVGAAVFGGYGGLLGSLSFVVGLVLAGGWLTLSTAVVRRAATNSPTSSMMLALMSYAALVILFAVLLGTLTSGSVHTGAFACGLVCAVVISTADHVLRGLIWSERR